MAGYNSCMSSILPSVKWCGHASAFHVWLKYQPWYITQHYYKERRNLEHYNNVSNLRVTEVGICIIFVLWKRTDGLNHSLNIVTWMIVTWMIATWMIYFPFIFLMFIYQNTYRFSFSCPWVTIFLDSRELN